MLQINKRNNKLLTRFQADYGIGNKFMYENRVIQTNKLFARCLFIKIDVEKKSD
ncbi:hypothetical protein RDn1_317 [Candidatus Termititenax dinenymphae]|uniref:Uncharacterized protein n=1 Tax=Candidatus Termititenax dinenymphae TaxID=2218523 RepID=A0A388TK25_9BACT|nr:hypothetical protein RDn1_317 [Candidatus Termititenax dinenymphae]